MSNFEATAMLMNEIYLHPGNEVHPSNHLLLSTTLLSLLMAGGSAAALCTSQLSVLQALWQGALIGAVIATVFHFIHQKRR
jgi:hypothetical protein